MGGCRGECAILLFLKHIEAGFLRAKKGGLQNGVLCEKKRKKYIPHKNTS